MKRIIVLPTSVFIWSIATLLCGQQATDDSSKESQASQPTRITGPKTSEGTIDYIQAINDRYGKDVTPQNNSAILMWQAIGPPRISRQMPPKEYFDLLGIKAPAKDGDYLIPALIYFSDKGFSEQDCDRLLDEAIASGRRPWRPTEFPEIAGWLKANERPLELMAEAVKRERYYSPLFDTENRPRYTVHHMGLPLISAQRDCLQMLISRAMMHAAVGNREKAWQDLRTCFRLARHVGRDIAPCGKLSAIDMDKKTTAACLSFIQHSKPSAEEIDAYQRDLAEFGPIQFSECVDVDHRCRFLDNAQRLSHGDMTVLAEIGVESQLERIVLKRVAMISDWEVACREGNEWFDQLLEAMKDANLHSRQIRLSAMKTKLAERDKNMATALLTVKEDQPELAGKFIAYKLLHLSRLPIEDVYSAVPALAAQELANLRVAFALAGYRADNERYPQSLAELKPKYLEVIPIDSYSGEELRYLLTESGYLLYSVGRNGEDDKGSSVYDEPLGDDLSIRVPDDFK